jgi:hypothetical protein
VIEMDILKGFGLVKKDAKKKESKEVIPKEKKEETPKEETNRLDSAALSYLVEDLFKKKEEGPDIFKDIKDVPMSQLLQDLTDVASQLRARTRGP